MDQSVPQSPDADLRLQKKPPGRPRKTSPRTLNIIRRELDSNPRLTVRQIKENNPLLLSNVSYTAVHNRIHKDLDFSHRTALKKPLVTHRQKRNRIKFANEKQLWSNAKWKKVLWSDESTFTVTGNRAGKVYRRPGSDPCDPKLICGTVKHPDSLMVWGCFSYYGAGKLIVLPKNETMNSEKYLMLLADNLHECFDKCKLKADTGVFQQDGASCHTAKIITEYLDFVGIDYIKPWPGNSPDLNPIENLWAIIKYNLRGRDTSSLPKLEAEIRYIWHNLSKKLLWDLTLSLPIRLREVKERKGHSTKY